MLERLVEQLGKELGMESSIQKGEEGYQIDFEPDLHLTIASASDGSLSLLAPLAPLPKEDREEFLKSCMAGNLFGRETGGAALGVEMNSEQLCMRIFLPNDLNYKEFRDAVEDFLNYAEAWRRDALVFAEVRGGS